MNLLNVLYLLILLSYRKAPLLNNCSIELVKSLKQLDREASILHTIVDDTELVNAMKSDAVKAHVIAMIMSSIYKKAYARIEAEKSIYLKRKFVPQRSKINIHELDAEVQKFMNEFIAKHGEITRIIK